jgi:hypothetical protein
MQKQTSMASLAEQLRYAGRVSLLLARTVTVVHGLWYILCKQLKEAQWL